MTFNSEIFSHKAVSKQPSYGVLNTKMLLAGFIGVSLVAIGSLNLAQSIKTNSNSYTQERDCRCEGNCLCGTGCGCSKDNLK